MTVYRYDAELRFKQRDIFFRIWIGCGEKDALGRYANPLPPFTQMLNIPVSLMGEPEQCSPPVWPSCQRVNDGKARATFTRYVKYVQSSQYHSISEAWAGKQPYQDGNRWINHTIIYPTKHKSFLYILKLLISSVVGVLSGSSSSMIGSAVIMNYRYVSTFYICIKFKLTFWNANRNKIAS